MGDTATKVAEYEVVISTDPSDGLFSWEWKITGTDASGFTMTRWGARGAARRACRRLLMPAERWTFTREAE